MDPGNQAIWIDLDNSPHVPLLVPVIKHYRERGHEVILTARDHSQTVELLKLAGLEGTFSIIGRHYGKGKIQKTWGLIYRAVQLVGHLKQRCKRGQRMAAAVSHGSRSMVLAAKWLKIPVITMYDYEFTETRIFNRFSDKVLIPEAIPDRVLDGIGLKRNKWAKYPGIKEEMYVNSFIPEPSFRRAFLENSGVAEDRIIVVLRPPASTANYHSERSDVLLETILRHLMSNPQVFTVVVPRTREQAGEITSLIGRLPADRPQVLILDRAVNGLNLVFASDLLISGGGTMNREAALLGVPVYSIFGGRQGALDAQMEKDCKIIFVRTTADIDKIRLEARRRDNKEGNVSLLTDRVERFVIEQIDKML